MRDDPEYAARVKEQKRNSYRRNKSRHLASCRAYAEKNADKIRDHKRGYYARRHQVMQKNRQRYYSMNRDRIIAAVHQYVSANREAVNARKRLYYEANPEIHAVHRAKRRARKRERPFFWSDDDVRRALVFWEHCCAVCKTPFGLIVTPVWDHWIPLADPKTPGTVPHNMIPLCVMCNRSKHAKHPEVWLVHEFPMLANTVLDEIARYLLRLSRRSPCHSS